MSFPATTSWTEFEGWVWCVLRTMELGEGGVWKNLSSRDRHFRWMGQGGLLSPSWAQTHLCGDACGGLSHLLIVWPLERLSMMPKGQYLPWGTYAQISQAEVHQIPGKIWLSLKRRDALEESYCPYHSLGAELCPLQICMLKPSSPWPQNVTEFGERVFREVIKLEWGHLVWLVSL